MNPNQYQISMRSVFEPEAVRVEPFNPLSVLLEVLGGTPPIIAPNGDRAHFADGWNAAMQHMKHIPPTSTSLPLPENVIFNDPATIVYWDDGTKTVVKCQPGDMFSAETGLTTAMLKKYMGNDNTFNRVINEWLKRTGQYHSSLPALSTSGCAEMPAAITPPRLM